MSERDYFLIEAGHPLKDKVDGFIEEMKAIKSEWAEFSRRHGGTETWHRGSYLEGLSFDGDPPEGWYSPKGSPAACYKPYANRSASREAYKEFKRVRRQKCGMDFGNVIGFGSTSSGAPGGGLMIHYASFEQIDDELIITIPTGGKPPEGLVPLKKSEYWQLKEEPGLAKVKGE